ncbi:DUF2516 family protein [Actinocorallia sp. API 0066]|uniref:DUF2516 family protein n=1 Tax=Actinocorallia sp. API 0066 TaxID=2896846 RepID=UPI001E2E4F07|nr:DUF2516 family protein [Actinocorallia sp. API 0066]MCD0450255.1 DUF2516 family protein [Actinocorallia sp. API 0066]
MLGSIHTGLALVFWGLAIVAFIMEAFSLVDVLRRPAEAFPAAGKQTKKLWLIILGFATLFGFAAATLYLNQLGIFAIAAFIASVIYLADVRPALKEYGSGGGRRMGPYGPW